MWAQEIFVYLYPLLSITCVIGYLPQIYSFLIANSAPSCFSFTTWFIWAGETSVSLGYGIFNLNDIIFCLLTSLDMLMIVTVIILAVRAKRRFGQLRWKARTRLAKEQLKKSFANVVMPHSAAA